MSLKEKVQVSGTESNKESKVTIKPEEQEEEIQAKQEKEALGKLKLESIDIEDTPFFNYMYDDYGRASYGEDKEAYKHNTYRDLCRGFYKVWNGEEGIVSFVGGDGEKMRVTKYYPGIERLFETAGFEKEEDLTVPNMDRTIEYQEKDGQPYTFHSGVFKAKWGKIGEEVKSHSNKVEENLDYQLRKNFEIFDQIQIENIKIVFKMNPEFYEEFKKLYKKYCGNFNENSAIKLYEEYIKNIFPESKLKNILWHGTRQKGAKKEAKSKILKEGFKKEDSLTEWTGHEFFGFYFGDWFSHYGVIGLDSIPVILDIRRPHLVKSGIEPGLSLLELDKGLTSTYNLKDEDGVIQIGYHHANDMITREKFYKHKQDFDVYWQKKLNKENLSMEDIHNNIYDFLEHIKNEGFENIPLQEVCVFNPEQIHVLGSKKDVEKLKNYLMAKYEKQNG